MRDAVSTLAIRARELNECEAARGRMRLAVAIVLIAFLIVFGALVALLICAHSGTWPTSSSVSPSKPAPRRPRGSFDPLPAGAPTLAGRAHTHPPLGDTLEEAGTWIGPARIVSAPGSFLVVRRRDVTTAARTCVETQYSYRGDPDWPTKYPWYPGSCRERTP